MELTQVIEVMTKSEDTIMKFLNSHVERLEKKIEYLIVENVTLKGEVLNVNKENDRMKSEMKSLTEAMTFHSQTFDEKVVEMKEAMKKVKNSENNYAAERAQKFEEKVINLEDRSRRNNLRFNGIVESEREAWIESEEKIRKVVKEKLGIEKEVVIERAHRTGKFYKPKGENTGRTIVAKFLNYKDKDMILTTFIEKELWKEKIYINEDFSFETLKLRKKALELELELEKNRVSNF